MRTLLTLSLCAAVAAPGIALAQENPSPDPLPAIEANLPAAEPQFITLPVQQGAVQQAPAQPGPAPDYIPPPLEANHGPERADLAPSLQPETTVAPVIVEAKAKDDGKAGRTAGTIAGGVIGGLAGAAVAGPVGKIAGSLVGKTIARTIVGDGKDKDRDKKVETAEAAPSADEAAIPTAERQPAAPLVETVAAPEPAR